MYYITSHDFIRKRKLLFETMCKLKPVSEMAVNFKWLYPLVIVAHQFRKSTFRKLSIPLTIPILLALSSTWSLNALLYLEILELVDTDATSDVRIDSKKSFSGSTVRLFFYPPEIYTQMLLQLSRLNIYCSGRNEPTNENINWIKRLLINNSH